MARFFRSVKAVRVGSPDGLPPNNKKAEGKTLIDYGFHMIVTDMEDRRLHEMTKLADEGVTSYKMFMAYPGVFYVDDGTGRFIEPCAKQRMTAPWFACMRKMALSLTKSLDKQ